MEGREIFWFTTFPVFRRLLPAVRSPVKRHLVFTRAKNNIRVAAVVQESEGGGIGLIATGALPLASVCRDINRHDVHVGAN